MKRTLSAVIKEYGVGGTVTQQAFSASEWRDKRPQWNQDRCFKCGICYVSCPDAAIFQIDEGFYDVDPDKCKGCGICSEECVNEAITMSPEEK